MRTVASNGPRARWLVALLLAGATAMAVGGFAGPRAQGAVEVVQPTLLVAADLRGHALLLFDPARPEDARRIPLPGGPHELALLPDGRVVTSLEQAGALALVDVSTAVVESIAVGGLPHGLVVHDGVLEFTDRDRDQVRRLRIADWAELDPIPSGHWPHALAALPQGGLVVANAGDDSLTMAGRTVAVSALPETVAVSPTGDRIATAGAVGDTVELLNADGVVRARSEVSGRPVRVVFDASGDSVAVALSASAAVALVDAGGDVRRVAVGGLPDGLAFDPAGHLLYVSDLSAGRLTAVDASSGRIEAVYRGGVSTGALLFVPPRGQVGGLPSPLVRQ